MTSQSGGSVNGYPGVASDGASGLIVAGNIDAAAFTKNGAPFVAGLTPLGFFVGYYDTPQVVTADGDFHPLTFDTRLYQDGISLAVPLDHFGTLTPGLYTMMFDVSATFDGAGTISVKFGADNGHTDARWGQQLVASGAGEVHEVWTAQGWISASWNSAAFLVSESAVSPPAVALHDLEVIVTRNA